MEQDVQFKGLTNAPSDHEASDGELGTCINLIPEDNALKPLYKAKTLCKDKLSFKSEWNVGGKHYSIEEKREIVYVHKVNGNTGIHTNYILKCYRIRDIDGRILKDYILRYCEDLYSDTPTFALINTKIDIEKINSFSSIGNVLCFLLDDDISYAIWKDTEYIAFGKEEYKFDFTVKQHDFTSVSTFTDISDILDDLYYESGVNIVFPVTGIRKLINAVDSTVNKKCEEKGRNFLKYNVFGFVSVRLYDGTNINLSKVFILNRDLGRRVDFSVFAKEVNMTTLIYEASIRIDMDNNDVADIIQGVDVWITRGSHYINVDKEYSFNMNQISTSSQRYLFSVDRLSFQDLATALGEEHFYRSIFIGKEDFGKEINLERVLGTEETETPGNKIESFGGVGALSFNNRLHVFGVSCVSKKDIELVPSYSFLNIGGTYPDCFDDSGNFTKAWTNVPCIIRLNGATTYYYGDSIKYPLPPFLSFSNTDVTSCDVYICVYGKYYRTSLVLYESYQNGISFYIHTGKEDDTQFKWLQLYNVFSTGDQHPDDLNGYTRTDNGEWNEVSEDTWNEQYSAWKNFSITTTSPNLIRVSEAENPLVFPASNSVQVGSSSVRALASNTHPISEGQFGTAPLYAFTDEGVWALITTGQGTYEARQPVNRDVVSNPKGIISTDDAVLYPTKRGIMLLQGNTAQCITDAIKGKPFHFTELFKKEFAKKVLNVASIPEDTVTYLDFDEFLDNADMAYDYKDNRLILYNNKVSYAYVFSMKSQMWGAMECDYKYNINVYPDAYVVDKNNFVKDIHNDNPIVDTRYIVCTRPLTLGQPEQFKTMITTIVRGYFRNRPGKCGIVLYGSNDMFNWYPIASSINQYLRGMAGSPYKYFRVAITGSLSVDESISNFSTDFINRWGNKLR